MARRNIKLGKPKTMSCECGRVVENVDSSVANVTCYTCTSVRMNTRKNNLRERRTASSVRSQVDSITNAGNGAGRVNFLGSTVGGRVMRTITWNSKTEVAERTKRIKSMHIRLQLEGIAKAGNAGITEKALMVKVAAEIAKSGSAIDKKRLAACGNEKHIDFTVGKYAADLKVTGEKDVVAKPAKEDAKDAKTAAPKASTKSTKSAPAAGKSAVA